MLAMTEGKVKTIRLPSGHMPMLSMPEKVVDILREEAGKASRETRTFGADTARNLAFPSVFY